MIYIYIPSQTIILTRFIIQVEVFFNVRRSLGFTALPQLTIVYTRDLLHFLSSAS